MLKIDRFLVQYYVNSYWQIIIGISNRINNTYSSQNLRDTIYEEDELNITIHSLNLIEQIYKNRENTIKQDDNKCLFHR